MGKKPETAVTAEPGTNKLPWKSPVLAIADLKTLTRGNLSVGTDVGFGNSRKNPQSDVRLKRDIFAVGSSAKGVPIYSFRYLWSDEQHVGVLAQDVLNFMPEAVIVDPNGFYSVDYGMLNLEFPVKGIGGAAVN